MKQKHKSIQVFSVSRSGRIRPQQLTAHHHHNSISECISSSSQFTKSASTSLHSKSNPQQQQPFDFESVEYFHKNNVKEKQKLAKYIKACPLVKIICCLLVTLLIAAGLTAFTIGFIFMNQKNTSTTTIEKTVSTGIISSSTTTTTVVTTSVTTTLATTTSRIIFALNQSIIGYPVTCSSVDNTHVLYTQCNDFQHNSRYGAGIPSCLSNWSTTLSTYWSATTICQAFLNSVTATFEAYYDCGPFDYRFSYSSNTWNSINDTTYTKHIRCYY